MLHFVCFLAVRVCVRACVRACMCVCVCVSVNATDTVNLYYSGLMNRFFL